MGKRIPPTEKARLVALAEAPKIVKKMAERAKKGDMTAARMVLDIAGLLPKGKGPGAGNVDVKIINLPQNELKALEADPALREAIDVTTS